MALTNLNFQTALVRVHVQHLFEFTDETVAQMPFRIPLLYEASTHKPVYHVVELAHAHSSLRDPILPRLNG